MDLKTQAALQRYKQLLCTWLLTPITCRIRDLGSQLAAVHDIKGIGIFDFSEIIEVLFHLVALASAGIYRGTEFYSIGS